MKIVLPVHHYPPRYNAGAELYTFRLARWLREHGHIVEVVCIEALDAEPSGTLHVTEDVYEGITVWRLAFDIWHSNDWATHAFDNPLLRAWFASYLMRSSPDVVHFQAGYLVGVAPLQVAAQMGYPTVLTLHDYWYLCPRTTLLRGDGSICTTIPSDPAGCAWCQCLESRRFRFADHVSHGAAGYVAQRVGLNTQQEIVARRRASLLPALSLPAAVIAPSRFLAKQFEQYIQPERLHVSRYGLDLGLFHNLPRTPTDSVVRLGYLGQITQHKGVHLLVEAFAALDSRERAMELHIYGGLDANPAYVKRLHSLAPGDARIHFHGRFENEQVGTILSTLDATVVPSIWYENSPLVIMESQAAGTPVVTAALGGMAELVHDEQDGLHFRAGDATDLARQLQRLIDDPAILTRLRAGIVPPRNASDEMAQVMAIYDDVMANQVLAPDEVPLCVSG